MRYLLAPLLLAACHATPEGREIPTVVVKGVSTDDIMVTVSAKCWEQKPDAYCESVSRALGRAQREDNGAAAIAAREQAWRNAQ